MDAHERKLSGFAVFVSSLRKMLKRVWPHPVDFCIRFRTRYVTILQIECYIISSTLRYVSRGPKSVGGITRAKRAHAQSQSWAVKSGFSMDGR